MLRPPSAIHPSQEATRSVPTVHLIPALPAVLVIARFKDDGQVLVLVDPAQPWRLTMNLARPLLYRAERRALLGALLTH
jgi:hypothetical protein